MPTLQVRDLPEPIYHRLKQEAASQNRSLAQKAVVTLAKGLEVEIDPARRRRMALAQLRKNAAKIAGGKMAAPSTLIREDRQR